jgi:hypothetical protein
MVVLEQDILLEEHYNFMPVVVVEQVLTVRDLAA